MKPKKYDFGGYATRHNIQCSDGRIIRPNAFEEADGQTVPLVYHHIHDDLNNVLGHAYLENRPDGVYAYGTFNESPNGLLGKEAVKHRDVTALSIYANQLKQQGANVVHGAIKEVSLVLSGANPGAKIDNLNFQHGESYSESEEDAFIYSGLEIENPIAHADATEEELVADTTKTESKKQTIGELFEAQPEDVKEMIYAMVGAAVAEIEKQYEEDDLEEDEMAQSAIQGGYMKKNVFDQVEDDSTSTLTHAQVDAVFEDMARIGSLKDSMIAHGITDIAYLFPEMHNVTPTPEMITRRMDWVPELLGGTRKSPFSRIKSVAFNMTEDEARAKGYVKGREKTDQVILALKRETTPQTIYKKQSLDRDDIIDITDFDVVSFTQAEMRVMLEEELGRGILVGDGRNVSHADKINPINIRPVYGDDELYTVPIVVPIDDTLPLVENVDAIIDRVVLSRSKYRGSGSPTAYVTPDFLAAARALKDSHGYRRYPTDQALADDLRVNKVVEVEVLEGASRTVETKKQSLQMLIFNPMDYTVGATKGGEITSFDDFDIDFNKMKYLIEARLSGALTKPLGALSVETVKKA